MKKKNILILISFAVTTTLILSACGSSQLLKTAEESKDKEIPENQVQNDIERDFQEQITKWEDNYTKIDKSVDDAIGEYEKEKVGETVNIELIIKEKYTDPREMAKFVSQQLFDFSNGNLSPEKYIEFLKNYGSPNILENTLTLDEDTDLALIQTIQNRMLDSGVKYKSYSFSTPNVLHDEVFFYRKMNTTDGRTTYSKTTLFKNAEGMLFFDNDDNSVPVDF